MKIDALLRAAQILHAQPAHTMSLLVLHKRLAREMGDDAASYAELYQQLKKRPDSFAIFDSPRLLPSSGSWPRYVREQYEGALEDAGLGACTRVALTDVPDVSPDDPIGRATQTVGAFWPAAESDPTLRDLVQQAANQLAELGATLRKPSEAGHPTTRPPDPPPEP